LAMPFLNQIGAALLEVATEAPGGSFGKHKRLGTGEVLLPS
jgi:hypothetical protein